MNQRPSTPGMLVRRPGHAWRQPSTAGYLNEAALRDMLFEQPSLIPGVGPGAVAVREFQSGVGPTDVCVVDGDGTVTVVECKLTSNAEVRRKIVGQVLDYAARLWRMDLADFDHQWQTRSGESLLEALSDDEDAIESLRCNLREGRFSLVLAVDVINDDLRRIVEYLNTHTSEGVRIFALELARAEHDGIEILLPRVYGLEIAATKDSARTSGGRASSWTPEDVLSYLKEHHTTLWAPTNDFLSAAEASGLTVVGTRATAPSLILRQDLPPGPVWPIAIYTGSKPRIQINYHWLRNAEQEGKDAFLDVLAHRGLTTDAEAVRAGGFKTHPSLPLSVLLDPSTTPCFIEALASLN